MGTHPIFESDFDCLTMSNSAGAQNAKAENGTQEVKKEPQEGEKNELLNLYRKRDELVKNLHDLEKQIYKFEESYLEDTQSYGNIVIGWENFNAESNRNRNKKFRSNFQLFECDDVRSESPVTKRGGGKSLRRLSETQEKEKSVGVLKFNCRFQNCFSSFCLIP